MVSGLARLALLLLVDMSAYVRNTVVLYRYLSSVGDQKMVVFLSCLVSRLCPCFGFSCFVGPGRVELDSSCINVTATSLDRESERLKL